MLILVGVTINLILGENGILVQAGKSKEKYAESVAREKLEIELAKLFSDKFSMSEYDQDDYINSYLQEQGFIVNGDIVIVDDFQFQIDRTVPKIDMSLGKGKINDEIKLEVMEELAPDYTKSTINIKITYPNELKEIKINSKNIDIPQINNGSYIVSETVLENKNYTIYVKDINNGYKISNIKITQISEDTKISNNADFIAFRNRVNAGATYEGKTITLMEDLDLSEICSKNIGSFEPVGINNVSFSGTFNGNHHSISNLYISTDKYKNLGLFCNASSLATIQNLKLNNAYINNFYKEAQKNGCIVGENNGRILNSSVENSQVKGDSGRAIFSGGLVGYNKGNIHNSYSNNNIIDGKTEISITNFEVYVGGISGINQNNGIIKNCYNTSKVSGIGYWVQAGGVVGTNRYNNPQVINCYNIGGITGSGTRVYIGGIVGTNGTSDTNGPGKITNSYCLKVAEIPYSYNYFSSGFKPSEVNRIDAGILRTYATILGEEVWVNDIQNEDKIWKYNNGYPILKWQVK